MFISPKQHSHSESDLDKTRPHNMSGAESQRHKGYVRFGLVLASATHDKGTIALVFGVLRDRRKARVAACVLEATPDELFEHGVLRIPGLAEGFARVAFVLSRLYAFRIL